MEGCARTVATVRLKHLVAHLVAAGTPKTGGTGHADAVVDANKAFHPLQETPRAGRDAYCRFRRLNLLPGVPKLGDVTMFDPDYIGVCLNVL